ncbi:hypothetical protein EXIGLDRAFT_718743 [Exidia glandulosa HHB12029]|uniref:Uncharacterized protein n=1 Tax=Exidia glandulosa HHB12029 TaxID=1314781 RepID=A0A165HJ55_EXIGL|nr:hypothetical protein EXIGLDRAFT_718743 [Exidia glandulosa HHB12029]
MSTPPAQQHTLSAPMQTFVENFSQGLILIPNTRLVFQLLEGTEHNAIEPMLMVWIPFFDNHALITTIRLSLCWEIRDAFCDLHGRRTAVTNNVRELEIELSSDYEFMLQLEWVQEILFYWQHRNLVRIRFSGTPDGPRIASSLMQQTLRATVEEANWQPLWQHTPEVTYNRYA